MSGRGDGDAELERLAIPREALALLSEGAHRCEATASLDWGAEGSSEAVNLLRVRALATLALLDAYRELAHGRQHAAVARILDTAQMAGDLMRSPLAINELIGTSILGMVIMDLVERPRAFLDRFAPEARADLLRGLAVLDESLELRSRALRGEFVYRFRFIERHGAESGWGHAFADWRSAFSSRLGAAREFNALVPLIEATDGIVKDGVVDLAAAARIDEHLVQDGRTPALFGLLLESVLRPRAEVIAHLRLLRMIGAHVQGETVVALDDPAGGKLVCEALPSGAHRFRSLKLERASLEL